MPAMLTDADCKNATCPADLKRRRLTDGSGLYLEVSPAGSKRWFWKFYPDGKESRLALGSYPEVTLKAARAARDEARKTRTAGTNPVQQRKADKLASSASSASKATTFEAVAREFHGAKLESWSPNHAAQWLHCLDKDVFPWVGSLPLAEVSAPMLLDTLRKVDKRGAVRMAHDLLEYAGQVFRYGIATGRCERDPAGDLRGALRPAMVKHAAALLEPAQAGELLRAIDAYSGQPATRAALALLADLKPLTGHCRYVFLSLLTGERCMSENTVRGALRRMGYSNDEMTAHGFRAMARTLIAERLPGIPESVIEA